MNTIEKNNDNQVRLLILKELADIFFEVSAMAAHFDAPTLIGRIQDNINIRLATIESEGKEALNISDIPANDKES